MTLQSTRASRRGTSTSLFDVRKSLCRHGGLERIGLMICKLGDTAPSVVVSRKEEVCQRVVDELSRVGPGSAIPLPANLNSDAACRELAAEISRREESRLFGQQCWHYPGRTLLTFLMKRGARCSL